MGHLKRGPIIHSKSRSAPENGDTVSLLGLKGHWALRASFAKLDVVFNQVLFPVGQMKDSNRRKMSGSG